MWPAVGARGRVLLLLVVVQLVFSAWSLVAKAALQRAVDPFALAMYREVFASICMHAMRCKCDPPCALPPPRQDVRLFLLLGLLSFGNVVGFIWALSYVSPITAALLHPTIPVFAHAIAVWRGLERSNRSTVVGIFLCCIGAVLVVLLAGEGGDGGGGVPQSSSWNGAFFGCILMLVQCLCMGALIVAQRYALRTYPPTTTTAFYYSIGTVLTAIPFVAVVATQPLAANVFRHTIGVVALVYGSLTMVFNYVGISVASKSAPPTLISASLMLQPPFTAILAVLFQGAHVTGFEVLGGLLIGAGLILVLRRAEDATDAAALLGPPPPTGAETEMADLAGVATDDELELHSTHSDDAILEQQFVSRGRDMVDGEADGDDATDDDRRRMLAA